MGGYLHPAGNPYHSQSEMLKLKDKGQIVNRIQLPNWMRSFSKTPSSVALAMASMISKPSYVLGNAQ